MKAAITLITRQTDNGDTQETRMEAAGLLLERGGEVSLRYIEPKTEDGTGASVRVTLDGARAMMERTGPITALMPLECGREQVWHYDTPYGKMKFLVRCTELYNEMTANGGRFFAAYTVDTAGSTEGMACTMEFLVKEVQE